MASRTPIFMYDRVNGETELLFIADTILARSHMTIIDKNSSSGSTIIKVVNVTTERPHRMILHYDGEDFQMLAVDDGMIKSIKAHMFTREIVNKHIDRATRRKRTRAPDMRKSLLSRCAKGGIVKS